MIGVFLSSSDRVTINGVQNVTEDQGEDEVEEKADYSSLRERGLCKSTPTLSVSGPESPARLYTPLALILLFWETSVAALACEGKGYKYYCWIMLAIGNSINSPSGKQPVVI